MLNLTVGKRSNFSAIGAIALRIDTKFERVLLDENCKVVTNVRYEALGLVRSVTEVRRDGQRQAAESPRAFLFGIARHVGLTALRRAKQSRTQPIGEVAAAPCAESKEDLQRMRLAMAELPEQIRETLELRLRDELSYEEIAAVLEIPLGTVRSRLHTALRLLRAAMT